MKNFLQKPDYVTVKLASGKTMILTHPYTQTKWLTIDVWVVILGVIAITMMFLPKEYTSEILRLITLFEFLYLISLQDKIEAYERCMKDIRKQAP